MKKLIIASLFVLPFFASASMPAFPMAFYGAATINGAAAPAGTVIRAYYGSQLAGEITLSEAGVYGYDNPLKQQLLISEGTSTLSVTAQSSLLNGGAVIAQAAGQVLPDFSSGDVKMQNLVFSFVVPTPPSSPGSSGGGGGGGGGGPSYIYGCMDKKAYNYSILATKDNAACLYHATTTISLPVPASSQGTSSSIALTIPTFLFTRNLSIGSSGIDVSELQKRLTVEGYYIGPVSGFFGPLTSDGVKKYQSAHGLETVGSVGSKTRASLNSTNGEVLGVSTTNPNSSSLTTEARAALIQKLLALISNLQKQLAALQARGSR